MAKYLPSAETRALITKSAIKEILSLLKKHDHAVYDLKLDNILIKKRPLEDGKFEYIVSVIDFDDYTLTKDYYPNHIFKYLVKLGKDISKILTENKVLRYVETISTFMVFLEGKMFLKIPLGNYQSLIKQIREIVLEIIQEEPDLAQFSEDFSTMEYFEQAVQLISTPFDPMILNARAC